ncbi:MAG: prolipoprotein diacylglyceryl transferase [Clostridiales bacterium]|nr:prolipoprotein diacylglyceryl transferase [Clostridiales bacterium]
MGGADISFVHLGIVIEHIRDSISIFGFRIAFYGIIIGCGMLAGIWVAISDAKRRGQDPEVYLDFALYAIICSVIGARIYYVIFEWDSYKNDLLQVFNLRAGGLAIYGGVIAGTLTLVVYSRVKKLSFFSMADSAILGLITGQIIGRWGNFFNREAFGGYTDSLFAMRLKLSIVNANMLNDDVLNHRIVEDGIEYIQVHPTFLYESVWNLCLLGFMLWYRKRKKFDGEMLFIYLFGYGLGRFWIERLRTDSLLIPGTAIAVSRALSLCLVLVAGCVLFVQHRRMKTA